MAKCKDCIHYDLCLSHPTLSYSCLDVKEQTRKWFKNKTDVQEVKHGYWIYHECVSSYEGTINGYSCSVCSAFVNEEDFDTDEFHKIYCGNCGAKMDGKKQEVKCKDCEYLMFSDCYGECLKAYKGVVSPDDSCGKGKRKPQKEVEE